MPNYPTSLDTLTNPTSSDGLASPPHATQHADVNDIVEALETKLGTGASTPTTTGHVLTVTGAGATAYQAASGGAMPIAVGGIGYVTGQYYDGQGLMQAGANTALVADTLYASAFLAVNTKSFDRIGISVTTGAAGNARLGIYASTTDGWPGALILDAGTVDTSSIAGVEITISQSLTLGSLYWLALVANNTATIRHHSTATSVAAGLNTLTATSYSGRLQRAFVYAALPNPWGTPVVTSTSAAPSIRLRAA